MRVLVLADIHSNWTALNAIHEDFDVCLCTGDLVDYGTNPQPCVQWIRENARAVVRGNHDHAVAQRVPATGTSGFRRLAAGTRHLQWESLSPRDLKYLGRIPVTNFVTAGDHRFYLVHGTPWDPMDEYLTQDEAAWERRLEGIDADFVCVGHTHMPFHLDVGSTQIINPGSVGQPRDGDPRAAYAIIENGEVTFHRIEYDIDACISQMRTTGAQPWVVELSEAVLRSGGQIPRDEMDAIGKAV